MKEVESMVIKPAHDGTTGSTCKSLTSPVGTTGYKKSTWPAAMSLTLLFKEVNHKKEGRDQNTL